MFSQYYSAAMVLSQYTLRAAIYYCIALQECWYGHGVRVGPDRGYSGAAIRRFQQYIELPSRHAVGGFRGRVWTSRHLATGN